MEIDSLINDLNSPAEFNKTLNVLTKIVVDTDPRLVESLSNIILTPEKIKNTNRFASLLKFFAETDFIPPLVKALSNGQYPSSTWLGDYLYALEALLRDEEEWLKAEESFVHLLGHWLLNTGGGEISWKASLVLAAIDQPATKTYFFKGVFDESLLGLTRIECLRGIMNHYRENVEEILLKLAGDSDEDLRNAVVNAREFLNEGTSKT